MATEARGAATPYSAIVLGATGNVGGRIVQLLIRTALCTRVVVVTRRRTGTFTDPKVSELVVDMDRLEAEVAPHARDIDIALVAFGVGKGTAKMPPEEVRRIEVGYPLAFCRAARAGGVRVCAVMTAAGADADSRMAYARVIGEKQKAIEAVGFEDLAVFRPAVMLGNSNTPALLNRAMPLVDWLLPARYHSIHTHDLARAMVTQSEQALFAMRQRATPAAPTLRILEYPEMKAFFVDGDRDDH